MRRIVHPDRQPLHLGGEFAMLARVPPIRVALGARDLLSTRM